jgi:poly(A) polymerase
MIRAVKYAAMTGFDIPPKVRNKIMAQARLLADISSSRLTEEIVKIINSSCPLDIVTLLENYGIYRYLQPNASVMMTKNASFKECYLRSIASLPEKPTGNGFPLRALIEDYAETITDWNDSDTSELFKNTFFTIRRFISPMCPQRLDLENALRQIFAGHGIIAKRLRDNRRFRQ